MDGIRCSRCILPATYPKIRFDEEGVCNVCRNYDRRWSEWKRRGETQARQALDGILSRIRKLHRRYDAVVPLSGGKDSVYVLYVAKKRLGLNVIAANFNNGFQSQQAIDNIRNAVRALNVDLVTMGPGWDLLKSLYRTFLLKTGEFCTPCNIGINQMVDRLARDYRIPLVLKGDSPRTDENSHGEIYSCSREYFTRVITSNGMETAVRGTLYEDALKVVTFAGRVSRRLTRTMHERGIYRWAPHPYILRLPEYVEWQEAEIYHILHNELNWQAATELKEHSDCRMNEAKCHLRYLRWGFGSKTQKFASLVRDGQIDRDTALAAIQCEGDEPEAMARLLTELDLDESHLAEIRRSYHLSYLS